MTGKDCTGFYFALSTKTALLRGFSNKLDSSAELFTLHICAKSLK